MNQTLGGRYRLISVLATGPTGVLWRGIDHTTDQPVAVKLLHPALADERSATRLLRARPTLSALWHPGIARLLDTVVAAGTVCLVSELVPGTDLARLLAAGHPLPPQRAARIVAALADTLAVAHRAGVVHGDVKPANVLVPAESGQPVRLTDFSVATLVRPDRPPSPYTPPWEIEGGIPTPASDVYALGAVLSELAGPVDPRLREVVDWCMNGARAPGPTAAEVAQHLRELAPRLAAEAVPARGPDRAGPRKRRRVGWAVAGLAAALGLALAVTVAVLLGRPAVAPPDASTTTPAVPPAAPTLPAAAAELTQAGGTEFVLYWFAALTHAVQTGDTGGLAAVTSPDCRDCQQLIDTIESVYAADGRFQGGGYVVRGVSTTGLWSPERPVYGATVDRSPRTAVGGGGPATLGPLSFANCVLVLEWTDDGWWVREVVSTGCIA